MTKINEQLIEQIEDYISIRGAADTMFTSDKWLRALLEENKRISKERDELREDLNDLERSFGALEHANIDNLMELEQVKAERDYALRGSTCDACRGVIGENDKLRTELSAKDKILKWAERCGIDDARKILIKYGGTP